MDTDYEPIEYLLKYAKARNENRADDFWISLGIETCNLSKWWGYCYGIILHSFGKSYLRYNSDLSCIKCLLDELVCIYYLPHIHSISKNGNDTKIIKIFYNNGDIKKYPIKTKRGKYRKNIRTQDKEYILKFIERLNTYLDYLENNVKTFPQRNGCKLDLIIKYNNGIFKYIKKMRRKINTLDKKIANIAIQN